MSLGLYILNAAGVPVLEPDTLKWAKWLETAVREVARDEIDEHVVSTVFLGIDHNHARAWTKNAGPPLLWETMIFWRLNDQHAWNAEQMKKPITEWTSFPEHDPYDLDHDQFRYSSLDAAKAGHARAVAMVKRRHFRVADRSGA